LIHISFDSSQNGANLYTYRHSQGIVDALFAVFTKHFFGTRTTKGLEAGIATIEAWDYSIVEAYTQDTFETRVIRKMGLLSLESFYFDVLGFGK
jgi:hypothetical protein